jgi:hypothetical protein
MPSDLLDRMRRNPARRPIKPVYIRKLVRYIEDHGDVP